MLDGVIYFVLGGPEKGLFGVRSPDKALCRITC